MHRTMVPSASKSASSRFAGSSGRHTSGRAARAHWPMIVLRSPKGWTGPKQVDGHWVEGFWRAHQVPLLAVHENPAHFAQLERRLRSYRPFSLAIDVIDRVTRLQVSRRV